jgi:hypothetical protein
MHVHNTALVHKPYNTDCEAKLDFENWYIQGLYVGGGEPTHVVSSGEASLVLSQWMSNSYRSAEEAQC